MKAHEIIKEQCKVGWRPKAVPGTTRELGSPGRLVEQQGLPWSWSWSWEAIWVDRGKGWQAGETARTKE